MQNNWAHSCHQRSDGLDSLGVYNIFLMNRFTTTGPMKTISIANIIIE
jgi:hypothetical protein